MTEQYQEEIVLLWNEGLTAKEIAKDLGLKSNTLLAYISRHRDLFPYRKKQRRLNDAESFAIYKDYLDYVPAKEIAKKFNVSMETVYNHAHKHLKKAKANRGL